MTTQKQIEANGQNAKQSTGPKSTEGKAVTRMNAMTHGILAKQILIPGEEEMDLRNLHQEYLDALQPVGTLESEFVDRIVATVWRLRRVRRVESGIYAYQFRKQDESLGFDNLLGTYDDENNDSPEEEQYLDKFEDLRSLGDAFITDAANCNAFSKLSRYETALHRSLQRDLHELQRLQAARKGAEVQIPIAVDVTIDAALPSAENEP